MAIERHEEGKSDLFSPYKMSRWQLNHRVAMAPLTRCRAPNQMPNEALARYYAQRATAGGLIISEATVVSHVGSGYPRTPGIYTEEQVECWKKVVDAVHDKGGVFFCQLWHVGRCSHHVYQPDGGAPVSSTNKAVSERWPATMPDGSNGLFSQPRALTAEEVPEIVDQFRRAAINAMRAGFDGVELHGAYGYIIDQFLKDGINDRTDEYGGSLENRCKFLMRVMQAVVAAIGIDRVGLKITPTVYAQDAHDSNPLALSLAVVERINKLQEAMGLKMTHLQVQVGSLDGRRTEEEKELLWELRNAYDGTYMLSGGFNKEVGMKAISEGAADLIAYGRLFISNPDLVRRFQVNAPLIKYDYAVFYTPDPIIGYTNYPFLENP
ncbi:hypothetical protein Nepgr_010696 [Nepenthes gracilis]|uniref:NADH:flavin oxidoreductase/NADH oxidase N-terminal domain-containing protein n=1 Tax=Nepenthes gracilis TaxID=150966 RepID=A0AAD3SDN7_NEPGR|nr:hypothetical protein Nepgr_010696 [Nepenthes gracilis]